MVCGLLLGFMGEAMEGWMSWGEALGGLVRCWSFGKGSVHVGIDSYALHVSRGGMEGAEMEGEGSGDG